MEYASQPTQEGERPLKKLIFNAVEKEVERIVYFHTQGDDSSLWDIPEIKKTINALLPLGFDITDEFDNLFAEDNKLSPLELRTKLIELIINLSRQAYKKIEDSIGSSSFMAEIEKGILLRAYDDLWIDHLSAVEHLRRGIGLKGYAQHDPLVEYKREAFRLFNELNALIDKQVAYAIFKIQIAQESALQYLATTTQDNNEMILNTEEKKTEEKPELKKLSPEQLKGVGRNDPCPCGSGKKFKKCHGANL